MQLPERVKNLRVPEDETLLVSMGKSKRFGALQLLYHVQQLDREAEKQFAAITINLGDGSYYVAYRGTDLMLQHHPKQRRLRNKGLYFLTDRLITCALNHILQKTGTIVVIHCHDAPLHLRLHKSRRKGSQIAAFRMTAHMSTPSLLPLFRAAVILLCSMILIRGRYWVPTLSIWNR